MLLSRSPVVTTLPSEFYYLIITIAYSRLDTSENSKQHIDLPNRHARNSSGFGTANMIGRMSSAFALPSPAKTTYHGKSETLTTVKPFPKIRTPHANGSRGRTADQRPVGRPTDRSTAKQRLCVSAASRELISPTLEDRCNNFGKMAAPLHRQRSNVRTYLMVLVVSLIIFGIVASQPNIRAALQSPDVIDAVALAAYTAYASLVLAVFYAFLEVQYRQLLQLAEREAGQAGALAVQDPWTYAVL
ncbi:hypothetical protein COCOBI_09-3270 [Coccomyxa sp. Obi]|nr:hypothetical protein COCOBI_09-3270 [Coccomyxa sp. Obi]